MNLVGNWSDPKSATTQEEVKVLQEFIEKSDCTCAFCGAKTRLTSKTPLGHFNVCVRDRSLPDEPINWVSICEICSDLNSLEKLKGKGSFIEAHWLKQGELTNLLKTSYAIALRDNTEWGDLKTAADAFLKRIDAAPSLCAEVNWDGSVEALEAAIQRSIHPFDQNAYINKLRFRFDLTPYENALRYWAVQIENTAFNKTEELIEEDQ